MVTSVFRNPQTRVYYGGMLLFVAALALLFLPPTAFVKVGLFFVAAVLLIAFVLNVRWGLYAMAVTSFFYGWEVVLSQYSFTKNIVYLSSINAPMVDLVALVLFGGLAVAWFMGLYRPQKHQIRALGKLSAIYAVFIGIAILAARGAFDYNFFASFKYVLRPMLFAYAAFVVLPVLLIQDRRELDTVLKIWFWLGVGIALFGVSSFFVVPQAGWYRVMPYSIGRFAPLGYNHNLIAEALIALFPAAFFLALQERRKEIAGGIGYALGTLLIGAAILLTLSRAGWVALLVELILFGWFFRNRIEVYFLRHSRAFVAAGVAIGVLAFGYMLTFLGSNIVSQSNANRLLTTEIVAFYAARQPWLGYGPGMYRYVLNSTKAYVIDFGQALESHGFVQKILLEEGILGLVAFVFFLTFVLWFIFRTQAKTRTDEQITLQVLFVMAAGAITFQLFNTSYFASVMWMPIGIALAGAVLSTSYER